MNILLGLIPFVGLFFLVRHMALKILQDQVAEMCLREFKFTPQGTLTEEQLDQIGSVITVSRQGYDRTVQRSVSAFGANMSADEYHAFELDIEAAAVSLSAAYSNAKRVCRYFSANPKRDITHLRDLAWPNERKRANLTIVR